MATVNLTLERLTKQGEIDGTVKKIGGKRLYIWSPIGPHISEIIITNPPYAKSDEKRYRVRPASSGEIKQLMAKKRTGRQEK